jgi:hypothetical protein
MSSGYDSIATPEDRRGSRIESSKTAAVDTVAETMSTYEDEDMTSPRKATGNFKSTPRKNNGVQKFMNFSRFRPSRPSIAGMTNPE